MAISSNDVKKLREMTGAGMMDCKKALEETSGDFDKAMDVLRKQGLADAKKREGRTASQGMVGSYIHMGGKIGVMVEVNCETDFVARTDDFKQLVHDIAMHIAAANPLCVRREEVPEPVIVHEKEIYLDQAKTSGKPEKIWDKMIEGRLSKFYAEVCLLEQAFVKDPERTVEDYVKSMAAKTGENIQVRRFARFALGETIEK